MDKQKFELTYLVIPAHVYKDNRLNFIALKTYGFIHSYRNPFFFSNEHLAKMFDCSTQSISDSIQLLKKLEYIDTTYKNKANGGKTRLVIDLYLDYNPAFSPLKKSEAPTITVLIDKDIKDNNKKKEIFSNKETKVGGKSPTWEDIKKAREERKAKKQPFYPAAKNGARYPHAEYTRKTKGVIHAEDVV